MWTFFRGNKSAQSYSLYRYDSHYCSLYRYANTKRLVYFTHPGDEQQEVQQTYFKRMETCGHVHHFTTRIENTVTHPEDESNGISSVPTNTFGNVSSEQVGTARLTWGVGRLVPPRRCSVSAATFEIVFIPTIHLLGV